MSLRGLMRSLDPAEAHHYTNTLIAKPQPSPVLIAQQLSGVVCVRRKHENTCTKKEGVLLCYLQYLSTNN